jgi:RimJ/RimL family protein N-acetyltransferase
MHSRGRTVLLRPFSESDITPAYLGWLNDPAVVRYSNQRFRKHDAETSKDYLRSFAGTDNHFVAVCRGNAVVGTITAYVSRHHGTADMGILIGDAGSRGRGIGKDAWTTAMRHLIEDLGIRKVCAGTLRGNVPMVRIMLSSGMAPDGVRVAHELVEGEPQDMLYYAKFRD